VKNVVQLGGLVGAVLLRTAARWPTTRGCRFRPNLVRPGDVVHVDLLLGNHGNDHRDFKIAGKVATLDDVQVEVVGADGRRPTSCPR